MSLEILEVHSSGLSIVLDASVKHSGSLTVQNFAMRKRATADTFADRLYMAALAKGIDVSLGPTALAKAIKINKQTVDRWIRGEGSNLTPTNLFKLADFLETSPRWLALNQGPPQAPINLTDDEGRLLDMFRALRDPKPQAAVLRHVSDVLDLVGIPSPQSPFS